MSAKVSVVSMCSSEPVRAVPIATANVNLDHIDERLRHFVEAPLAARVRQIMSDVTIIHSHLVGLLNEIEWLIREPKRQRARGLCVCGAPGAGKTALVEHVQNTYPIDPECSGANATRPRVVAISMSGARKTKDILSRVLAATRAPLSRKVSTAAHEVVVVETLRYINCRLLILDEAQDVLQIAEREQVRVLETVKYLMNTLRMPVLAFGIDQASTVFRADPHLQARFDVLEIAAWQVGEDFGEFLYALERSIPLKYPSNLSDPGIQTILIKHTRGVLDKILRRIRIAAVNAAADGTERITKEALDAAMARPVVDVLGPR